PPADDPKDPDRDAPTGGDSSDGDADRREQSRPSADADAESGEHDDSAEKADRESGSKASGEHTGKPEALGDTGDESDDALDDQPANAPSGRIDRSMPSGDELPPPPVPFTDMGRDPSTIPHA
ncbi:MAG: hypothetical protein ABR550_12350, partial [Wenzhouxiangellaceae bacterium]